MKMGLHVSCSSFAWAMIVFSFLKILNKTNDRKYRWEEIAVIIDRSLSESNFYCVFFVYNKFVVWCGTFIASSYTSLNFSSKFIHDKSLQRRVVVTLSSRVQTTPSVGRFSALIYKPGRTRLVKLCPRWVQYSYGQTKKKKVVSEFEILKNR